MKTSLPYYYAIFGITFIALTITIALLKLWLETSSMSGISMIAPFLSATFVAERFLKKEHRLPTPHEKSKLVWAGLLIFLALNCVFVALAWSTGIFQSPEIAPYMSVLMIILAVIMVISCLVNFFLMHWAYAGLLRKRAEKLGIDPDRFNTFR